MFTTMTFNLKNAPIRRETLHGRSYMVAPMAMLTEGVHTGNGGALLYREAECKKAVPAWNMKPVVVYHPEINGKGVSACDADILERQQVGMVMNTRWAGKLRAEAWIDEDLAGKVDSRVLEALEKNKMMEVSTGLFTDNVGAAGDWNGVVYNAEATNHQPDHLALLPDKIGACSIADGAGLLQLNDAAQAEGVDLTRVFAREIDTLRRIVGNAMSHSNIYGAISSAVRKKYPPKKSPSGDSMGGPYLVDVYDGFFVYENENKLYRLNYTSSDAGVEITGEPEEVIRVTEYRTAAKGEFVGNDAPQQKEKDGMKKEKIVDALISNAATQWGEGDREVLMGMEEVVLNKLAPAETTPEKKPEEGAAAAAAPTEGDAPAEPVTMEAYVAAAPPELRDVLTNGVAAHNAARDGLVAKITANKDNKFSKEFLSAKGIQELQGLAALCGGADAAPTTVPMFDGAATPAGAPVDNAAEVTEGPLDTPVMNFADKG